MLQSIQFTRLKQLVAEQSRSTSDLRLIGYGMIQSLCGWFHCEWGTLWHVREDRQVLLPIAAWRDPLLPADRLWEDTRHKTLAPDEGNAGIVWRTGQPKCASNLVLDMCLPRSLDARDAGLVSGIWIPVRRESRVDGVVEMLGTHYWSNSEPFLRELSELGAALGECLASARAKEPCAP